MITNFKIFENKINSFVKVIVDIIEDDVDIVLDKTYLADGDKDYKYILDWYSILYAANHLIELIGEFSDTVSINHIEIANIIKNNIEFVSKGLTTDSILTIDSINIAAEEVYYYIEYNIEDIDNKYKIYLDSKKYNL